MPRKRENNPATAIRNNPARGPMVSWYRLTKSSSGPIGLLRGAIRSATKRFTQNRRKVNAMKTSANPTFANSTPRHTEVKPSELNHR